MGGIGAYCIEWKSDEKILELQNTINEWKEKQPDYIAVKMTNAEMVNLFQEYTWIGDLTEIKFLISLKRERFKFIDGELYQKTVNPKNYYNWEINPIIPWED